MSKLAIKAGSKKETVNVFIQDSSSTTGAGLTGLVYNSASLVASYVRQKGARVAITLDTLAAATSAWTSGGFKEIDATNCPGLYRLDLPDAALLAGVRFVTVLLKGATNMATCVLEIDLKSEVTATAQVATIRSGTAQTGSTANTIKLDSGASSTDNIYANNVVAITGGTGVGQTRSIVSYNGTTKVATVDKNWVTALDNTSAFDLYASPGATYSDQGTAQTAAAGSITLAATASATDDIYNGSFVSILSGTGSGQTRVITDYVGATQVATVDTNWSVTPDSTSAYAVIPAGNVASGSGGSGNPLPPTAGEIAAAVSALADSDPLSVVLADGVAHGGDTATLKVDTFFIDATDVENYLQLIATVNNSINFWGANVTVSASPAPTASSISFAELIGAGADDSFKGNILFNGSSLYPESREITSFVSATGTLGVDPPFSGAATVGDSCQLILRPYRPSVGTVNALAANSITAAATAADFLAEINAEMVDALATDTYGEPGQGAPPATASIAAKLAFLYKAWRNKKTQTATQFSLFGDDMATVDQKATVGESSGTTTIGEVTGGP